MVSQALTAAFRARRARQVRNGNSPRVPLALSAIEGARKDLVLGRIIHMPQPAFLTHGDVIRSRGEDGTRRTYVVAHLDDEHMGAPWAEHDGHGVIRECQPSRFGGTLDKAPGERLFSSDESGATIYAYDIPATLKRARDDEWGLPTKELAALGAKLKREPTAREVTAEAVRLDFERMRDWVRDGWRWIGVALVRLPGSLPGGRGINPQDAADAYRFGQGLEGTSIAASLWGIESDAGEDYLDEVARELVSEADAASAF